MQVEDDQIGQEFPGFTHRLNPVASLEHRMTALFQNGPDQFTARGFIVRYQHSLHNVCSNGILNVKQVPLPGSLFSEILPPCWSTSRFVIARPSPVPSCPP